MGTCSRIATLLHAAMLWHNVPHLTYVNPPSYDIYPAGTPDKGLPEKSGNEVYLELGSRYLLRYLLPSQISIFLNLSSMPSSFVQKTHYVTPTPYSPEETVPWLALPRPNIPRIYVVLLNPSKIPIDVIIRGPRWVRMGGGIEYVLEKFPIGAMENIGTDPTNPAQWPLLVT